MIYGLHWRIAQLPLPCRPSGNRKPKLLENVCLKKMPQLSCFIEYLMPARKRTLTCSAGWNDQTHEATTADHTMTPLRGTDLPTVGTLPNGSTAYLRHQHQQRRVWGFARGFVANGLPRAWHAAEQAPALAL